MVRVSGPNGFLRVVSGTTRMVFHAWIDGKVGYAGGGHRGLFTTTISIVDGAPVAKT